MITGKFIILRPLISKFFLIENKFSIQKAKKPKLNEKSNIKKSDINRN